MSAPCKLIFGLRVETNGTTLKVEGIAPDDPPSPLIIEQQTTAPWTVPYDPVAGRWQTELDEGDYIVRLELPTDVWIEGVAEFSLGNPCTIVYHWDSFGEDKLRTYAWSATQGTGGNPTGEDEKDPWPPPGGAAGFDGSPWMLDRLAELGAQIDNPRSGPPVR